MVDPQEFSRRAASDEVDEALERPELTWGDFRWLFDRMSDALAEWQGVPVPLPELHLTLESRHPMAALFKNLEDIREREVNPPEATCVNLEDEVKVRNSWWSGKRNAFVYVVERHGRIFAMLHPQSPDRSMTRLGFGLRTLGAADAWSLEAEYKARLKLQELLAERQWQQYELTGTFLEKSERSGVHYWLRRLRPTVALVSDKDGADMRCIACLCLHAIGYYQETWAGAMVPTDDVISHLLFIRADEPGFWKIANQHKPHTAEAGL